MDDVLKKMFENLGMTQREAIKEMRKDGIYVSQSWLSKILNGRNVEKTEKYLRVVNWIGLVAASQEATGATNEESQGVEIPPKQDEMSDEEFFAAQYERLEKQFRGGNGNGSKKKTRLVSETSIIQPKQTVRELRLLVMKYLMMRDREHPVKAEDLVRFIANEINYQLPAKLNTSNALWRQIKFAIKMMIEHDRIPVASSMRLPFGHFIATSRQDFIEYWNQLNSRENSIRARRESFARAFFAQKDVEDFLTKVRKQEFEWYKENQAKLEEIVELINDREVEI